MGGISVGGGISWQLYPGRQAHSHAQSHTGKSGDKPCDLTPSLMPRGEAPVNTLTKHGASLCHLIE